MKTAATLSHSVVRNLQYMICVLSRGSFQGHFNHTIIITSPSLHTKPCNVLISDSGPNSARVLCGLGDHRPQEHCVTLAH